MTNRKVRLRDVALEAGVSVSTASEALSGRGRMTASTRTSVQQAAQRLGYQPNTLARGLRTGRTRTLGLHRLHAAENFDSEYFRELVAGVMEVALSHDYDVTLLSGHPSRARVSAPHVDGFIIADPISSDRRAVELLRSSLPIVAAERFPPDMPAAAVIGIDHGNALRNLLEHAYASGSRRPVLFAADADSGWGEVLREAFLQWCEERGVPGQHRSITIHNRHFADEHGAQLQSLLIQDNPVDLVIVPGEHAALAALDLITKAGLRTGRDVLLATCADAHLLQICDPPVTAIDLAPRRLGSACAAALIEHLDDRVPLPELSLLPAEVHIRATTARLVPTP